MNTDHDLDRRLRRALSALPPVELSADFAEAVARRAAATPTESKPRRWLLSGYWAAAIVVLVILSSQINWSGLGAGAPTWIALAVVGLFTLAPLWLMVRFCRVPLFDLLWSTVDPEEHSDPA